MQAIFFINNSSRIQTWGRVLKELKIRGRVFATDGQICAFPSEPTPLGIDLTPGRKVDPGRSYIAEKTQYILQCLKNTPDNALIFLAQDDDPNGDVLAMDIALLVSKIDAKRSQRILRLRPTAITCDGLRTALSQTQKITNPIFVDSVVYGRARWITDRWISATFTTIAQRPIARVRTALLGATHIANAMPSRMLNIPEIGEITFQARSANGGLPYTAKVSITEKGREPKLEELIALAQKFQSSFVPGAVRKLESAGAAIAPRFGKVEAFNTADLLAYAKRHFKIPPIAAMEALEAAFEVGMISNPKTSRRDLTEASAAHIARFGSACGIQGLDPFEMMLPADDKELRKGAEGIHITLSLSTRNAQTISRMIRTPIDQSSLKTTEEIRDALVTMIARRCFEAARKVELERGNWHPDNHGNISPNEALLLSDLTWQRETSFRFPWSRDLLTNVRAWPSDSVLIEILAGENIGQPGTIARQVRTAMHSGDLSVDHEFSYPKLSPQGMAVLKGVPVALWNPATCRAIEEILLNTGNFLNEPANDQISKKIQRRLLAWYKNAPKEMQQPLAAALLKK